MKRFWSNSEKCITLVILVIATACSRKDMTHADTFVCPMHPTVIRDQPGTCPVCGMDLVKKGATDETELGREVDPLLKPVNQSVVSSIRVVAPMRKQLNQDLELNGVITYDTRRSSSISSRYSGRIEKLFLKYDRQTVYKGQKIMEVYSPELRNAQRDLLFLIGSDKEDAALIEGAKEKLRLLGLTEEQVNQLITSGTETNTWPVFSPLDGYWVKGGGDTDVREGSYVNAGDELFTITNSKQLWAEFDVYNQDVARMKVGQVIHLTFDDRASEEMKIDFIQPINGERQSFVRVRVYLPNDNGQYRVGQLVGASLEPVREESMVIPISATYFAGKKSVVFVKRGSAFEAREILQGKRDSKWTEILKGLEKGDSVAYNAQFMVDSEGFIKTKD